MTKVYLKFSIICGDDKRVLEEYVDSRNFTQRKSYDEYYIVNNNVEINLDLGLLMILAEHFKVTVLADEVEIAETGF